MANKLNRVTLNIGEHGNAKGPKENEPPLLINGTPIHHLRDIKIEARAGEMTLVALSFYAEVDGNMVVEDEGFKFGGPEILEKK